MREATGNTDAAPVRPWVLTDLQGVVLDASTDAEELFRITRRALIGRNLYTFFDGERPTIMHCASVAASVQPVVGFQKDGTLAFQNLSPLTCPFA